MNAHESTSIFPLMKGDKYADFVADIKKNGLQEKTITLHPDGSILDGRNRHRACQELGIEPKFKTWNGEGSPLELILSLNIHRLHSSASERAAIAVELLPQFESEARERQRGGRGGKLRVGLISQAGPARKRAARLMDVDETYVSRAKKLKQDRPDLFQRVKQGDLPLTQAKYVVQEDGRQQMRDANLKRVNGTLPLPTQEKYQTIVIDPPWDYEREGFVNTRVPSVPYVTMSLDDIAKLPVGSLAQENCHLYLWTTNLFLPMSFALLEKWGFKYATLLTWVKPRQVLSHWFNSKTEHVIFGVKGSQPPGRRDATTVILGDRPKRHSTKPEEFYKLVESYSPGPWLEMFARKERPGWKSWGAEVSEGEEVPVLTDAPAVPDFERGHRAKVLKLG
jgi:N6-adenosine-specific RNA methylase IME4